MSSGRGRRRAFGDAGERLVARHLERAGWRILERQWRGPSGEIDLVALDGDLLVFVEVKTRRGGAYGEAEEAVDAAKAARLLRLGEEYVQAHAEHEERYWRVDLIAVSVAPGGTVERLTHLLNVCEDG